MGATGMGGSSNLEDFMLISEDGAEPINSIGTNVVRVLHAARAAGRWRPEGSAALRTTAKGG